MSEKEGPAVAQSRVSEPQLGQEGVSEEVWPSPGCRGLDGRVEPLSTGAPQERVWSQVERGGIPIREEGRRVET